MEPLSEGIMNLILAILFLVFAGLFAKKKTEEKEENRAEIPESVIQWEREVLQASNEFNVPFNIAMSVLWVESAGNENAKGSAGEIGLMQLKEVAIQDLLLIEKVQNIGSWKFNPVANIRAGVAYLSLQNKRCKGNWECAIKSYNQGFAEVQRVSERDILEEQYYKKVKSRMKFF